MKIIYNNILPPKGFTAINLFGVVFARRGSAPLNKYILNHESIHTAQIRELLYIPFYIMYTLEWSVRIIQYRSFKKAYFNISFEREAYANDSDLKYLKKRGKYEFRKYFKKRRLNTNLK